MLQIKIELIQINKQYSALLRSGTGVEECDATKMSIDIKPGSKKIICLYCVK